MVRYRLPSSRERSCRCVVVFFSLGCCASCAVLAGPSRARPCDEATQGGQRRPAARHVRAVVGQGAALSNKGAPDRCCGGSLLCLADKRGARLCRQARCAVCVAGVIPLFAAVIGLVDVMVVVALGCERGSAFARAAASFFLCFGRLLPVCCG
jgi:hypothetical protein